MSVDHTHFECIMRGVLPEVVLQVLVVLFGQHVRPLEESSRSRPSEAIDLPTPGRSGEKAVIHATHIKLEDEDHIHPLVFPLLTALPSTPYRGDVRLPVGGTYTRVFEREEVGGELGVGGGAAGDFERD